MTFSISPAGLSFIVENEGFRREPAPLPDGDWVIGFGHVRSGQAGGPVSEFEAAHLLSLDLAPIEKAVNALVTKPLSQTQYDALVSFASSIGVKAFETSQVLRRVNSGQFIAAACAMDAWRKGEVAGALEVVDALVRRRAGEKAMFLRDLSCGPATSALLRAKLDHAASVLGAPIKCAPAPALETASRSDPARRLTEILRSEPATEVLLLTEIVTDEPVEAEITTAHAKPSARSLDREAAAGEAGSRAGFSFLGLTGAKMFEDTGLVALFLFGVALVSIGGSMLMSGAGDAVDLGAAAALVTPGLAAALMAGFGFMRGHQPKPVKA